MSASKATKEEMIQQVKQVCGQDAPWRALPSARLQGQLMSATFALLILALVRPGLPCLAAFAHPAARSPGAQGQTARIATYVVCLHRLCAGV
jgi:hypothetical protein